MGEEVEITTNIWNMQDLDLKKSLPPLAHAHAHAILKFLLRLFFYVANSYSRVYSRGVNTSILGLFVKILTNIANSFLFSCAYQKLLLILQRKMYAAGIDSVKKR